MTPFALLGDAPTTAPDLAAWLAQRSDEDALSALVLAIAGAPALAERLALGRLPGDRRAVIGVNDSGDRKKALDVAAHDHLLATLSWSGVCAVLSEEAEEDADRPLLRIQ